MQSDLSRDRQILTGIVRVSNKLLKLADRFFKSHGTTEVHFNVLMILAEYAKNGIHQQELSDKLIVTKSNIVGLVNRMEKKGLAERHSHAKDKRLNLIRITEKGHKLLKIVRPLYFNAVESIASSLSLNEKEMTISITNKLSGKIDNVFKKSNFGRIMP